MKSLLGYNIEIGTQSWQEVKKIGVGSLLKGKIFPSGGKENNQIFG